MSDPSIAVIMGVSGSGKSTIAAGVAAALGWDLGEGDDLHPASNVAKMAAGIPLTDDDRAPWLRAVRAWIDDRMDHGRCAVIACSALKRAYRDVLRRPEVLFVLLDGDRDTLLHRMQSRPRHFMPPSLLDSQLETLQRPAPDERATVVPISDDAAAQVAAVCSALGRRQVG